MNPEKILSIIHKKQRYDTAQDVAEIVGELEKRKHEIEMIEFSGNTLGTEAAAELAKYIRQLKKLRVAKLGDIFTTRSREEVRKSVKEMCDALIEVEELEELDLSDNAFGPVGAESMYDLIVKSKNLKVLYINNNGLGIDGGKTIARAIMERSKSYVSEEGSNNTVSKLEKLWMGRNRLENGSSKELGEMFAKSNGFKVVKIAQNGIRSEGIENIMEGLKANKNLEELDLQDNTLSLKGSEALATGLKEWANLVSLNVGDCLLGKNGGKLVINELEKCKQLELVNLQYNEIEEKQIEQLVEIVGKLERLRKLELNGNRFCEDSSVVAKLMEKLGSDDVLGSLSDMEELTDEEEVSEVETEEEKEEELELEKEIERIKIKE